MTDRKQKKFLYGATVCLSAAMLMILEIDAGRMIAPYVGNSLYTWTSVIGVILAGLSLGNWLGGILADRGHEHPTLGMLLGACSAGCLLILVLLPTVTLYLQSHAISLAWASLLIVTLLFFVPSVLIGTVGPMATTLYLELEQRTGHAVGLLHALAALGSIAGTFAAGYYLIQFTGTRRVVVFVAIVLFLLALPYLGGGRRGLLRSACLAILLAGISGTTRFAEGLSSPCTRESQYYCLRVVDEKDNAGRLHGRSLVIDHMLHSTNLLGQPDILWTPYVHGMDTLVHRHFPDPDQLRYYFAGGGAYTHPRSLAFRYPQTEIVVSEIDPAVTELALSSLDLDPAPLTIHHTDSRRALAQYPPAHFDVIITDVFHDVGIPPHLLTREYHQLAGNRLKSGGLYLANVIDHFPSGQLVRALYATIRQAFPHVGVWIERPDSGDTRLTYIFSGSARPFTSSEVQAISGEPRIWYDISTFVDQQGKRHGATVLTDDYAPVERLISALYDTPAGS